MNSANLSDPTGRFANPDNAAAAVSSAGEALRLGVNIDHVATVRNARGGDHPDPVRAALAAAKAGADGITAHLREDRRHIIDADVQRLRDEQPLPLNFEMAATADMLRIALDLKPHACCLVPERREERTTEGGLDVSANPEGLRTAIATLKDAGIRVSLFIEADERAIAFAAQAGADIVELHTGRYCDLLVEGAGEDAQAVYRQLEGGAWLAHDAGLEVHAGHGLRYDSAQALAALSQVVELNIGHFMVGEALFDGFDVVIARMREHMDRGLAARSNRPEAAR